MDDLDAMLSELSSPSATKQPSLPQSTPVTTSPAHSMNNTTYTPANAVTSFSGPGSAARSMNSVTMTPANSNSVYATNSNPGGPQSMNSVTYTPANSNSIYAANNSSGGGPQSMSSVTYTPANSTPSYSGPGPAAHSMNSVTMTPANSNSVYTTNSNPGGPQSMNSVTYTPANSNSIYAANNSSGGGSQSMSSVTYTSANSGASSGPGRTINMTPANGASSGPGATSFSGPGTAFSGPGPSFSGPGPSFSGPGPSFSGPGPSFSGPGPSFSGPGPSFSGPGPAFSGTGPKVASSGPGPGFASSGPGAAWAKKQESANDEPIKLATKTADGRDIIHKGPPCANCGEMIIGQCTNALGKTYHPDHFVCTCCSQPFVAGKFLIKDNEPYCETDFYELFGNKCKTCGDPIKDKYISASESLFFHPEHFVCDTCGIRLVGKKFKVQETSQIVLCIDCHVKRIEMFGGPERICSKCLQPIQGEFVVLKGQYMHAEHFRCEECGCAFVGGNCHEFEGALYCTTHYEKLLKKTCAKCRKPILGRGVSAVGRMWHAEHFCCFTCGDVLNESSFFEKDGEAYCETHYAALFATMCDYCSKPILADGRSFLDKHYHAEHFKCSVCDNLLKTGHIREWDSKPYCDKCYDKLPSEVRKKYEKKKMAEAKIEKKHEIEEKKAAAKEEKAKAKAAKQATKSAKS